MSRNAQDRANLNKPSTRVQCDNLNKLSTEMPLDIGQKRRTRSYYVGNNDENDNQSGLKKTKNRTDNEGEKLSKGSDWGEKHSRSKRTRHADVNENMDGLKNKMTALGGDSGGDEYHWDSNRAEKKMSVSDRCDNRVKRCTRSFYLVRNEGNENMKKNETQEKDKDERDDVNEKLKKNKITGNKDDHAVGHEKLEKKETPARDKGYNVSNKDIKTGKNDMPGRPSRNDYNLPPPDENTCQISNDREDCCKTMCKICEQPYALTKMRFHTLKEHNLQITKYKEIYGPFVIIDVVYHKCELCGKLVLLDGDFLGAHIKSTHKMKESVYYNQYMINNPDKYAKKQSKKNKFEKMLDFEFDFNKFEYDCNMKDCQLCGKSAVNNVHDSEIIVDEEIAGQQKAGDDIKLDRNIEWDPAQVCSDLVDINLDNSSTMEMEVHGHVKDLDQDENEEVDEDLDPRGDELPKFKLMEENLDPRGDDLPKLDLMKERDKYETFSDSDDSDSFDYTVISAESDGDNIDHKTDDDYSKEDTMNSEEITLDTDEFGASSESDVQ